MCLPMANSNIFINITWMDDIMAVWWNFYLKRSIGFNRCLQVHSR